MPGMGRGGTGEERLLFLLDCKFVVSVGSARLLSALHGETDEGGIHVEESAIDEFDYENFRACTARKATS